MTICTPATARMLTVYKDGSHHTRDFHTSLSGLTAEKQVKEAFDIVRRDMAVLHVMVLHCRAYGGEYFVAFSASGPERSEG
jgi:hypothetical protein